ncbi:MAG: FG-GAP repeat protein, partial [Planctomycetota bacterium]
MRYSTRFRTVLLVAVAAFWVQRPALANPIVPVTLAFEREGVDLDTGTVVPIEPWTLVADPTNPQPDLVLACNSDRAVRAVVFHNRMNGVQIAFVDGVPFNLVGSADLAGLSFTAAVIDEPFETGDSVVLRTDTGAHYLLGNPVEDATGVTFDTQLLEETTAGLVRPETDEPRLARGSVAADKLPRNASPTLPAGLSAADWQQIRWLIEEDGYRFQSVSERPGAFSARNALHGLQAELDGSGLRLSSLGDDAWEWGLDLTAYGYAGALRQAESGELIAQGKRLEHQRGDLVEWYVNDGGGLEQGFTLAVPPAGQRNGPLALRLVTSGSLAPFPAGDGSGVRLVDGAGRTVLRYAGLLAWDAMGRELPAQLAADAGGLTIEVDDAGAAYPVTIDPTVVNEDAKLTASDAAAYDLFGSVALSGDTAVVGAPGDDHASGTDAGSAYVFVRNGATWSEQAKLTASDAAADDRFGSSVAISGN